MDETGKVHRNFQYDAWGRPLEESAVQTMSLFPEEAGNIIQNEKQYVNDMTWKYSSGDIKRDDSVCIDYDTYAPGITCDEEDATIQIELNGEFSTFHALVGLDEDVPSSEGNVEFYVNCVKMDGSEEELYYSGRMTGRSDLDELNLPVGDVDILELVMDSRFEDTYDRGIWGDAYVVRKEVPSDPAAAVYVSDMTWESSKSARRNENSNYDPISIGSISRSKGIGTSDDSEVYVSLNGLFDRFVCHIGVDDETEYEEGDLQFRVIGDNSLLYISERQYGNGEEQLVEVDVSGVQTLCLLTIGDGYGAWSGAYLLHETEPEMPELPEIPETYDPFEGGTPGGEITGEVNAATALDSLRYAEEYYDAETGLIYLRNRYYDPSIGRFITEDPARDGLNWYSYCGNNPIMYVDPSGNIREPGYVNGVWCENPDAYEFGEKSLVYDSLSTLGEMWNARPNNRSDIEELANEVRKAGRQIGISAKIEIAKFKAPSSSNATDIVLMASDMDKAFFAGIDMETAKEYANKLYGADSDGSQHNALKHTMWNALMTKRYGENYAKMIANSHEFGAKENLKMDDAQQELINMDLFNNAIGRNLGNSFKKSHWYGNYNYELAWEIARKIDNKEIWVVSWVD